MDHPTSMLLLSADTQLPGSGNRSPYRQLSNIDINGEAIHASSMGLPPALSVTTAKVGKLEIMLPYVSNVQTKPVAVQIDKLNLVLEENPDADVTKGPSSAQSPTASGKSNGYGFADKINESWKKLEWEALSIDLLPHPDMFTDANLARSEEANLRDDDGAKRVFFGGERFLDGISGQAHITVQRTALNSPLGLEVQLHIPEAVCPALSEPGIGLHALLRFLTRMYLCLNRGDVDPKSQQQSAEAVGRSLVSVLVDHVHLQEEACLRISSFSADGIVVNPGDVLPCNSVNSLLFTLKELDVSVPLDMSNLEDSADLSAKKVFAGAKLHIENLSFVESPTLKVRLLNLKKDPACFSLWPGQPIGASQKKWIAGVSHFSLALETSLNSSEPQNTGGLDMGLWNCVEGKDVSLDVAMVSADGKPLITIPPHGGIVRIGVALEQLFFVLDLYSYFGKVSEKISIVKESKRQNTVSMTEGLLEKNPWPRYCTSNIYWENIEIDCVDTEVQHEHENNSNDQLVSCNGSTTPLRRVFWVVNGRHDGHNGSVVVTPFLDKHNTCDSRVRLGGGMSYTEALLHND
ncbi:hypothetical protein IGI04_019894 [Brassica rapa subsp. trilocularis]|uniref:Uncharacterized protein n=1 Tax=Brassica rapa subsp. trilocularis TaxID=1813537 RepID=A0ABQ7MJL4_BRACM|nr:hypothetical protein IGI04_019894 [Brassica rapa subsp. trilocularis]